MCAGNANREAHHAREQAKRDAAAAMAQQEQAYREMLSMIPKPPKPEDYTPGPMSTRSSLDDTNSGVSTAKSKRKSTLNMNKGVASLRIPLNTGGSSGGGLNIG
jgi:hypothetical protein